MQAKFSRKKAFPGENIGSEEETKEKKKKPKKKKDDDQTGPSWKKIIPPRVLVKKFRNRGAVWRERKSKRKREKIMQTLDCLFVKIHRPLFFFFFSSRIS